MILLSAPVLNELGEDIKKRNNCNGKCSMCKKRTNVT